eukprot:Hpha_TRINITY_DN16153_c3_g3::TRINITY_DN16153_c3_g3_i2::g.4293::m.4293
MQRMMARALQSRAVVVQVRMAGSRKADLRAAVAKGKQEGRAVAAAEKALKAAQEKAASASAKLKKVQAEVIVQRAHAKAGQKAKVASKTGAVEQARAAEAAAKGTLREKRAELVATRKAFAPTRALAKKAQSRLDRRSARKAAGPVKAKNVFLAEELKGQRVGSGDAMRSAHAKWASMSEGEKVRYESQAEKNRAERDVLMKQDKPKKSPTPYQQHFRTHFPAAYKKAVDAGADRKAAFVAAAKETAALWKAQ